MVKSAYPAGFTCGSGRRGHLMQNAPCQGVRETPKTADEKPLQFILARYLRRPMDIQVATLCDSAMDYNSKLCVLGTFDTIGSRVLPVVHPAAALALRICFRAQDEGTHQLSIRLIDDDGTNSMQPLEAAIEIQLPESADFVTRNMILNFQPLRFEKAGQFSFEVSINGQILASIPLRVIYVEEGQAA